MKSRDAIYLGAGAAAGALVAGAVWLLHQRLTEVGDVEAIHVGEPFPPIRGTTLAKESVTAPDDLAGRVGLLVLGFDYAARFEVAAWATHLLGGYGTQEEVAIYEMPMISGVGVVMRNIIDSAMLSGTPEGERSNVLTVYGDLRWLRKRLGITDEVQAYIYVLGRTGRLAWRVAGPPTEEAKEELAAAMREQGINPETPE